MNRLFASIDPQVWRRFVQTVKSFARGPASERARS